MHLRRYPVRNRDGRWGYIDQQGQLVIDYQFEWANPFSEGLASVTRDGREGFIDINGRVQFEHPFRYVSAFSNGLAACQDEKSNHGFINRVGEVVIVPKYRGAASFQAGVAIVFDEEHRFGIIRRDGSEVIPCELDFCHSFWEGEEITTAKAGSKWGLISLRGEVVRAPTWEYAHQYSEGIVPVRVNELWGLANHEGEIVCEPQFAETNFAFREGRIGVTDGKDWWFVDAKGRRIGSNRYSLVNEYVAGMARVCVGGKYDSLVDGLVDGSWGFVNLAGEFVIEPRYDECDAFEGELARVQIGDDEKATVFGYINRKGDLIWTPSNGGKL